MRFNVDTADVLEIGTYWRQDFRASYGNVTHHDGSRNRAWLLKTSRDGHILNTVRKPVLNMLPASTFSWLTGKRGFQCLQDDGLGMPDQQQQQQQQPPKSIRSPEEEANLLSRVSFSYVDSLVHDGAHKHLQQGDLWEVARSDEAARVYHAFTCTLNRTATPNNPQGVLWRSICLRHWVRLFWSGVLILLYDLFLFMPPYFLERLLNNMARGGSRSGTLGWAAAMLLAAVAEHLTLNMAMHTLFRLSLHVKIAMIQVLYAKSLRVTCAVRADMGVGSIVNLQSNDAAKVWNTPLIVHVVWNGPLQVLVVTAMLVRVLHWAPALAGLCVTVLLLPLSTLVGNRLSAVRRDMVRQTDARVRLASEIISGIKCIKLHAWEDAYMQRMHTLREQELLHIRRSQLLALLNQALFAAGPVCVALAAFAVYSLAGHTLTASVAFPALALFNLLRVPIIQLPAQVMSMIQAHVGLQRIQTFLQADEIKSHDTHGSSHVPADNKPAPSVVVADVKADEDDKAPLLPFGLRANAKPFSDDYIKHVTPKAKPPPSAKPGSKRALSTSFTTTSTTSTTSEYTSLPRPSQDATSRSYHGSTTVLTRQDSTGAGKAIQLCNACFTWQPQQHQQHQQHQQGADHQHHQYQQQLHVTLRDVSLSVRQGMLVMIVGQVGAGKSSLLHALLGEMNCIGGSVEVVGTTAYTAQDPWIQHSTLRSNILLGQVYEEERYTTTLAACALGPDLQALTAGDATEIGEKGINLSGGQKHRVALARAVYSSADVYLLDDPLSAVDAHVGRQLFDTCICGVLEGRTRVLVTHQLQYLPAADLVVVMAEGRIKEVGSYHALMTRGVNLNLFVTRSSGEGEVWREWQSPPPPPPLGQGWSARQACDTPTRVGPEPTAPPTKQPTMQPTTQPTMQPTTQPTAQPTTQPVGAGRDEAPSTPSAVRTGKEVPSSDGDYSWAVVRLHSVDSPREALVSARKDVRRRDLLAHAVRESSGKIVQVEERAVGQVDRAVYRSYLSAWASACVLLPLLVVLLATCERTLQVGQNLILALWTTDSAEAAKEGRTPYTSRWLSLYFMLGVSSIVFSVVRALATVAGSVSASRSLYQGLMSKVLRLPLSFYDSQPTGRLLNRITRDTEAVDIRVSESVNTTLSCLTTAALSLLVVSLITPVALVALLPLAYAYYRVQVLYVSSSRELKRMDALAFSPIFSHLSESLHGLTTIRAFNKQDMFRGINQVNLDSSNRAYWPIQTINRWLSVRLELMGALIVFVTAVSVAVIRPSSPGRAGLAISSALHLTGVINWMVRQVTELELHMNSVERLNEYNKLEEEAPAVIHATQPPPRWPCAGIIEARSLTVRYRPELDPVLHNLSFQVSSREKVGVCGRTGSGKSTLSAALYRLVEPCGGSVFIDGLDISTLGLRDLRSRLSMVAQDPVIFHGTIRSNLDPLGLVRADHDIWEVLRRVDMAECVRSLSGGLLAPLDEGGCNLSVGQRQLLCVARALLRDSRILILDEATSNVDPATDRLIQASVRNAFQHCTVITIAHRLHTIIHSDRVMVLDRGHVAEYDTPHNLMQRSNSMFLRLVEETTRGGGGGPDAVVLTEALAAARGTAAGGW